MTNTGPDLECTWWPDGWPTWFGGQGNEWLHCCVAHDMGGHDLELFQCVGRSGWPLMAAVMVSGLVILGPIYRWVNAKKK